MLGRLNARLAIVLSALQQLREKGGGPRPQLHKDKEIGRFSVSATDKHPF
jgi:hypothetical protein